MIVIWNVFNHARPSCSRACPAACVLQGFGFPLFLGCNHCSLWIVVRISFEIQKNLLTRGSTFPQNQTMQTNRAIPSEKGVETHGRFTVPAGSGLPEYHVDSRLGIDFRPRCAVHLEALQRTRRNDDVMEVLD